MTIFLASLAGMPPLGGWIAKFSAFKAVLDAGTACGLRARRHRRRQHRRSPPPTTCSVMREMWMERAARRRRARRSASPASISAALGITAAGHDRRRRAARTRRCASATCSDLSRCPRRLMTAARPTTSARAIATPAARSVRSTFVDARAVRRPHGFYRPTGGGAGRRGDFLTVAGGRAAVRRRAGPRPRRRGGSELGRPDPFTVVDAGAGPGTLAADGAGGATGVRRGAALRRRRGLGGAAGAAPGRCRVARRDLPDATASSASSSPTSCSTTCRSGCACSTASWREAYVVADAVTARSPRCSSAPLDPLPAVLPVTARFGEAPLLARRGRGVGGRGPHAHVVARRGVRVVILDYVRPSTPRARRPRKWRSWLRTYRGHQRGAPPPLARSG